MNRRTFTLSEFDELDSAAKDEVIRYAKSKGIHRAIVWGDPQFEERVPEKLFAVTHGELKEPEEVVSQKQRP